MTYATVAALGTGGLLIGGLLFFGYRSGRKTEQANDVTAANATASLASKMADASVSHPDIVSDLKAGKF